ncbi:MAG: insulinase family protein [Oscillospiraceae bacterium]|jgi:predicted Zn-dependent peptidase|nr:insulinase family protein [Oscillospiraceae bacterium]
MKKIISSRLNEEYFVAEHPSGLKIFLYPKKNYSSSYAAFSVNYGSINNRYKLGSEIIEIPDGTAHFLEHKLFENKEGDAFNFFSEIGSSANAGTSFDKTVYLFSCSSNNREDCILEKSLVILLDFVQNPYFTENGVNKERGIISQEIAMYQDSPSWKVLNNCLQSLYHNHPVKIDIVGSQETIKKITSKVLQGCYDYFYSPSNMNFCVVGNFEPEKILEIINKNIKFSTKNNCQNCLKDIMSPEPKEVVKKSVYEKMEIINPIFNLAFKEEMNQKNINLKELIVSELALCALMLKSGKMYNRLLDSELISTSTFDSEYFTGPFYAASFFSGESRNPEKVAEIIREEASRISNEGMDEDLFVTAKKIFCSEIISIFDNISATANALVNFSFANKEIFNFLDTLFEINLPEVNELLRNKFNAEHSTLSVISL